jgi:hypothetical protein
MTVTAIVERTTATEFSNDDLMAVFREYKQKYGDVGLMLVAMNLELVERCSAMEERITKLEAKRR